MISTVFGSFTPDELLTLRRRWAWLLMFGLAICALGILALSYVVLATVASIYYVGATMLAAVPTTHGAGELLRALVRPGLPEQVHAYFHDTDLVDARRRQLIALGLRLLARRRPRSDLDAVASTLSSAPLVHWRDIARGEGSSVTSRT